MRRTEGEKEKRGNGGRAPRRGEKETYVLGWRPVVRTSKNFAESPLSGNIVVRVKHASEVGRAHRPFSSYNNDDSCESCIYLCAYNLASHSEG